MQVYTSVGVYMEVFLFMMMLVIIQLFLLLGRKRLYPFKDPDPYDLQLPRIKFDSFGYPIDPEES